ncbi:hypothetical protein Tco_0522992 [Tanacetum coccineum]
MSLSLPPQYAVLTSSTIKDPAVNVIDDRFNVSRYPVLPNNTAYSAKSIRRTNIQQIDTVYSNQLNMAYRSPDTNFLSDDNDGRMAEKSFLEIQRTFLVKIRDNAFNGTIGENAVEHIENFLEEDLVEKFVQRFYQLSYNNEEMEADEDDNPDDVAEIFKIEGNLFDFETPLCKAFNEFNYLLKIDTYLFTFDIEEIRTYEEHEYELNNNMTSDLEEPWSDNGMSYQLCDHLCEPYRFKDGKFKWPTCSADIDGFCNGEELPGMAAIRRILEFGIRRIDSMYRSCCKEIDELVTVYSGKRRVLNSYGHYDASSTHFCSRTQIGESSRAKYQGSSSF